MPGKRLPGHIGDADKLILRSTIIQVLDDRPPYLPLRRVLRRAWFTPYAKHRTHLMDSQERRWRPNRMTVGVPWPGIYAPEVSMTCVRSMRGKNSSISFLPNSRFMNELAVIMPT